MGKHTIISLKDYLQTLLERVWKSMIDKNVNYEKKYVAFKIIYRQETLKKCIFLMYKL